MKCLAPASLLSPWGSEGWLACVVNPASSGRRWGGSLARKDPDGQNETVRSLRRGNASDRTGHKEPHLCYDLVTFSVESRFLFFFFFFAGNFPHQCLWCYPCLLNLTRVLVPDHQLYTQRFNVADLQIQHVTLQTPNFSSVVAVFRHTSGGLKSTTYQTPISNSFGKKKGHKATMFTISQ